MVLAGSVASEREARAEGPVSFGIGPIGVFGGNFISKVDNQSYLDPDLKREVSANPTYPGFGGSTYGAGFAIDIRVLRFVGVEIDAIWMRNRAKADIDFTRNNVKTTYSLDIGHDAWHIPVLFKAVLPLPIVSPFLLIGPEFVRVSSGPGELAGNIDDIQVRTRSDHYTFFSVGLGAEFKLPLPAIPYVESIRVPLSFRYSHYAIGSELSDRAAYQLNGGAGVPRTITYDTRWGHQVIAALAVQAYF